LYGCATTHVRGKRLEAVVHMRAHDASHLLRLALRVYGSKIIDCCPSVETGYASAAAGTPMLWYEESRYGH